ncbi:GAF domain-containing sensor histidine kinase [Actinoplanes sp. NPDC051475]|uniref:GAF domain-containing sensor histidine kinase n=1 Tax=Actinoplanes sp. NPDC051475 TaxID=3157225 RepID=UPI00344C8BB2
MSVPVLDPTRESDYDDVAALAAQLCGTPIALVSLVDREAGRDSALCAQAMRSDEIMQVADARADPRFRDDALVTGEPFVRFYAGAPLIATSGHRMGSLSVIDREPRLLTPDQRRGLRTLARQVVTQLELRRYAHGMADVRRQLSEADQLKDQFLARITHELRTPLTSITGYLEILEDADMVAGAGAAFVTRIRRNSERLVTLVDDMLLASRLAGGHVDLERAGADLAALAREAGAQHTALAAGKGLTVVTDAVQAVPAHVDVRRIGQALDRLVRNAIKFTDHGSVTVAATTRAGRPVLEVRDTGVGIDPAERDRVLAPFRRASAAERAEAQGSGLGLSIVAAIADAHGGTVEIADNLTGGTTVTLTF